MAGTEQTAPSNSAPDRREPDSGYWRLEDQLDWYDRKSVGAQTMYKRVKTAQIIVAALVPVSALVYIESAIVPGVLGAVILILEGFQELGAYQRNWIKYRSACESLRHEKFLFLEGAGPYETLEPEEARRQLVQRVEMMVSEEHTHWAKHMETQAGKKAKAANAPGPASGAG